MDMLQKLGSEDGHATETSASSVPSILVNTGQPSLIQTETDNQNITVLRKKD